MKATTRRAFTLIELLTVIAIIMLLISILMPSLGRAREMARRTVCLTNLRAISQGCTTYATGSNRDHFPCWSDPSDVTKMPTGFNGIGDAWDWDGVSAKTFSGANAPARLPVSNTRNLWKLVLMQAGDTKTFICPSDGEGNEPFTPAVLKSQQSGWSSISDVQNRSQFSFAFQYQGPIPGQTANTVVPGWNTTMKDDPKMVILADSSPAFHAKNVGAVATADDHSFEFASSTTSTTFSAGNQYVTALAGITGIAWDPIKAQAKYNLANSKDIEVLNSPNHRGEGQNFMRLDGSGDFAGDPWAGAYKDNIWTIQDAAAYKPNATDDELLKARMIGLYDAAGQAGATNYATYDTATLMPAWVLHPESKTKYPDSFLVP